MKHRKYCKELGKTILFLSMLLSLLLLPATAARADIGPKPEVTVKILNPPEGVYYLDLLTKAESHFQRLDLSTYDPVKIKLLEGYQKDGWKPGLVMGTPAPMWGDLVGVKTEEGMEHHFGYIGVPDEFKLIIVTPENKIVVSDIIKRKSLKTIVTYDYVKNTQSIETPFLAYLKQFLGTYSSTLLIEGILLLVFGFSLRSNIVLFLTVNLATQLLLTATIGVLFVKTGIMVATIAFFPMEILIITTECLLYATLLKEYGKLRRVAYAVTANVLSAALGMAIMSFVYI